MDDPAPIPPPTPPPGEGSRERGLLDAVFGQAEERPSAFAHQAGALPPPDAFPGYELLGEIHRGGQGVVYLALQKATKRRVAIKVLHEGPFGGSSGKSRFEREVQILGQLNHPNIVHIHDSGTTTAGSFFYVMDYISGKSLDELIDRPPQPAPTADKPASKTSKAHAPPSLEETLRLFLKICDGVNAAHLKGVIHRDLKPANIRVDQRGEPIVVDFGLAKVALAGESSLGGHSPAATMTGQFIGSLPWASPEQADGSPDGLDVRTDVYSLGVILYQLLTGRFPYSVIGAMRDVLDNILRAEPARPSTIRRQINGEVETIVLKCLAKDKNRRYQSAGELARDIERYLRGEPIEAKRDSALYLISKTLKRHRVTAGVLAAFATLILSSAAVMTMLYGWERQARRDEQTERQKAVLARNDAEAQRDRANRNFAAGRTLARSFLYDFSRDIANLRGATPARERLAREASTYLDALRGELGEDPAMLRELADAFDQLGRVQGGLYLPRVGTTDDAARSFAKARQVRQALADRFPNDPRSAADLARSDQQDAWIAERAEQYPAAATLYTSALERWARARDLAAPLATPPDLGQGALFEPARCTTALGDAHVRLAENAPTRDAVEAAVAEALRQYDLAQAEWDRLAAANPADPEPRRALTVLASKRAAIATSRGRAALEQAETILKPLAKGSPLPDRALDLLTEAVGRLGDAARRAQDALDRFDQTARDDPANAAAERDVYIACNTLGLSLSGTADPARMLAERLGLTTLPDPLAKALGSADGRAVELDRRRRALAVYTRGLTIAQRLAENDPKNIEAQRDWAVMLNKVGNEHRFLARLDEAGRDGLLAKALDSYTRSRDLRASLLKTDTTARHLRDLALAEFKLGQVNLALADAAEARGDAPGRLTAWRDADRWASSAATRFRELASVHHALAEDAPAMVETRELQEQVARRAPPAP